MLGPTPFVLHIQLGEVCIIELGSAKLIVRAYKLERNELTLGQRIKV